MNFKVTTITIIGLILVVSVCFSIIGSIPLKSKDTVDDCCCKKSNIDESNNNELNVLLNQLVKTRYFKYFRVNLFSECPFWVVTQLCGSEGCGVCECDENEIPLPWRIEDTTSDKVDLSPPPPGFTRWKDKKEDMWVISQEGPDSDMSYVDLSKTPEAFTGYDGSSIWSAIYNENCFTRPVDQMCLEERVFYKLISGLHSSITTHIALYYTPVDKETNVWQHNSEFFKQRFSGHPDRIENLYFTFLFVLRSVGKISNLLTDYQFNTGNQIEDQQTTELVQQLLQSQLMCSPNFDESLLFKDTYEKENLIGQFKEHFQNISSILNCVTCEKCKLYGKMQTLGLGTALKILFDDHVSSLQRNEIIALINTLRQLSNSIKGINTLRKPFNQSSITFWGEELLFNFKSIANSLWNKAFTQSTRTSNKSGESQQSDNTISSTTATINTKTTTQQEQQQEEESPFSISQHNIPTVIVKIISIIFTILIVISISLCVKKSNNADNDNTNNNNSTHKDKKNNNNKKNNVKSPKKEKK